MRIRVLLALSVVGVVWCAPGVSAANLEGGPGSEVILGTNRTDVIAGKGGSDRLFGKNNKNPDPDRISGGSGDDEIYGAGHRDFMKGGADSDLLEDLDGTGGDVLEGGPGNDLIIALDESRTVIRCGDGNDTVFTEALDDVAPDCESVAVGDTTYGPFAVDFGAPTNETLTGGAGQDWILTGGGGGTVNAGAGDDRVSVSWGNDTVNGEDGSDTIVDDDGEPGDILNGGDSGDFIYSADGADDQIDCGVDVFSNFAIVDGGDTVNNCEIVISGGRQIVPLI